jgi:type I restriction enzyme, S subunit
MNSGSLKIDCLENWSSARIGELAQKLVDGSHNPPQPKSDGLPMLSARNINDGRIVFDDFRLIDPVEFEREHKRTRIEAGDVLLTTVGTIGRSAVVRDTDPQFTLQRSVSVISLAGINPDFLRYQFETLQIQQELGSRAKGTAQKGVYLNELARVEIQVAPTNEQARIVSKIDELFSRIEAGEKALQRAKILVERYRKSVLKAAVTGELTKDWRENNKDKIEPANKLLERILKSRREAWEKSELAKLKAKGKLPKDDAWKKKYVEPAAPKTIDLPDLPEGWIWASVEQIALVSGGLTKSVKRGTRALTRPMLRVGNVYADRLDLEDIHETTLGESELERVLLKQGDLLVVEGNGSVDQIGRVAIWDGSIPDCVHQNHLIKIRFDEFELGRYCLLWLLSSLGREFIQRVASSSSGLHTLSISKIEALPFPLAPMHEANEIVRIAEDKLAEITTVGRSINGEDKSVLSLRQAVLKTAFEGKLVPQDASDEPASVLLERIRSATAAPKLPKSPTVK